MKKQIKYVGLITYLIIATQSWATCNGGTFIASRKATDSGCNSTICNEKTLCVSDNGMNWWSAMVWCKANGMQLVDFDNLCPKTEKTGATCQNWRERVGIWTRTTTSSSSALVVRNGDAWVFPCGRAARNQWGDLHAACE